MRSSNSSGLWLRSDRTELERAPVVDQSEHEGLDVILVDLGFDHVVDLAVFAEVRVFLDLVVERIREFLVGRPVIGAVHLGRLGFAFARRRRRLRLTEANEHDQREEDRAQDECEEDGDEGDDPTETGAFLRRRWLTPALPLGTAGRLLPTGALLVPWGRSLRTALLPLRRLPLPLPPRWLRL